jgi:general secretion pathway protein G
MSERDFDDSQDVRNQRTSRAGRSKSSAAYFWIVLCCVAVILIVSSLIIPVISSSTHLGIGEILGIISLFLIVIRLVWIKRLFGLAISAVLIIGVALLILPKLPRKLGPKKSRIAQIQISEFEQTLEAFQHDTFRYPATDEGLDALVHDPGNLKGWSGPYLKKIVPLDLWGRPYRYRCPGEHNPDSYDLWSDGPDGTEGTDDDVVNWQK